MSTFLASIQLLKKTYANLVGVILLDGQPAYDETNNELRIGDGSTVFESLPIIKSNQEFYFDVTIPAADVLTLNTTPIELVPAQGANKVIIPTGYQLYLEYNTTAYATNGDLQILLGTLVLDTTPDTFLFSAVDKFKFEQNFDATDDLSEFINQPLSIQVDTGNPTAGDSDIRIFGTYKVIDIS
jgi:hypothetical protein